MIDYEPVAERYLKPFFGTKPIDCIKAADIAQYRSWRRDYWVTGPGSKQVEYEYDRNGQTIKRKRAHKAQAPSPQTINGENVVLRGIFKFACDREWANSTQVPKVANVKLTRREARERAYLRRGYTNLVVMHQTKPTMVGVRLGLRWSVGATCA